MYLGWKWRENCTAKSIWNGACIGTSTPEWYRLYHIVYTNYKYFTSFPLISSCFQACLIHLESSLCCVFSTFYRIFQPLSSQRSPHYRNWIEIEEIFELFACLMIDKLDNFGALIHTCFLLTFHIFRLLFTFWFCWIFAVDTSSACLHVISRFYITDLCCEANKNISEKNAPKS